MFKLGFLALIALAGSIAWPARAAVALDYGVGAFMFVDAGGSHWFTNAGGAGVTDTGLITQGVSDTARGGAQIASTSAYASLGSLGGHVLASSSGTVLEGAQGSNDLSWYTDFLVTGTPGTRVAYVFAASLEGLVAGAGTSYGGVVRSTTFVAGVPLADWALSTLDPGPGPFDEFALATLEFDVGTVIRIASRLGLSARAEIDATAEADALHTSSFYVDVITPCGGYVAGADAVFPHVPVAAVPEAPTTALLAVALALLGWSRSMSRVLPAGSLASNTAWLAVHGPRADGAGRHR
jgi:hypothetical protein